MIKKICIFSSFSERETLDSYIKLYIEELLKYHDKVILVTNKRNLNNEVYTYLKSIGVELFLVENEGLDFGMWYKVLKTLDIKTIERLSLVNDSCFLIRTLDGLFKWVDNNLFDYSGISDSTYSNKHIQSYFLVIKKPAIQTVFEYFMVNGIINGKLEVISVYEIGLSKHLMELGFKIGSMFDCNSYEASNNSNITLFSVNKMIEGGCPTIKKKVAMCSFSSEDYNTLVINEYKFNYDYKSLVEQHTNLELSYIDSLPWYTREKLAIWQIFFDDNSFSCLDKGLIPYDNRNNLTLFFEGEVIIDVYDNQKERWKKSDYVGVLSWRFKEKTNLTYELIANHIRNSKSNVDIYNLLPISYDGFNSPFSEVGFLNTRSICKIIDKHNLFPFKLHGYNSNGTTKFRSFCNYYICKPEIFEDFVNNYFKKLFMWLQTCNDPDLLNDLRIMITHRGQLYPIHPFLMEGLFECYVEYKQCSFERILTKIDDTPIEITPTILIKKALNSI